MCKRVPYCRFAYAHPGRFKSLASWSADQNFSKVFFSGCALYLLDWNSPVRLKVADTMVFSPAQPPRERKRTLFSVEVCS
jgi:hypothetical protein